MPGRRRKTRVATSSRRCPGAMLRAHSAIPRHRATPRRPTLPLPGMVRSRPLCDICEGTAWALPRRRDSVASPRQLAGIVNGSVGVPCPHVGRSRSGWDCLIPVRAVNGLFHAGASSQRFIPRAGCRRGQANDRILLPNWSRLRTDPRACATREHYDAAAEFRCQRGTPRASGSRSAAPSLSWLAGRSLENVERREQEEPDGVHEMPVVARSLHCSVPLG